MALAARLERSLNSSTVAGLVVSICCFPLSSRPLWVSVERAQCDSFIELQKAPFLWTVGMGVNVNPGLV